MKKLLLFFLILLVFSILFISCAHLSKNTLNAKYLFIINMENNNQKCYIYKENNKIMFKYVNIIEKNEELITQKQLQDVDIDINTNYIPYLVNNNRFFLYINNSLYIINVEPELSNKFSANTKEEIYYINPNLIINNIKSLLFKYKTCFYINHDGNLLVYNTENDNFIKYDTFKTINNENLSFDLITVNEYAGLINNQAKSWYNNWRSNFLNTILKDGVYKYTDDENNMLHRYNKINKPSMQIYKNIDDWYNNFYKKQNQQNIDTITQKKQDFKDKWGIEPNKNIELFNRNISTIKINEIGKDITEYKYFGKNENIKFFLKYYYDIIIAYQEFININASNNTIKLLETFFSDIKNEIIKYYNEDIKKINDEYNTYEKDIDNLNKSLIDKIKDSVNNFTINIQNENNNQNTIKYSFLPNNGNQPDLLIIYNNDSNIFIKDKTIHIVKNDVTKIFDLLTFEEIENKKTIKTNNVNNGGNN